jgi:hypothetical protein
MRIYWLQEKNDIVNSKEEKHRKNITKNYNYVHENLFFIPFKLEDPNYKR